MAAGGPPPPCGTSGSWMLRFSTSQRFGASASAWAPLRTSQGPGFGQHRQGFGSLRFGTLAGGALDFGRSAPRHHPAPSASFLWLRAAPAVHAALRSPALHHSAWTWCKQGRGDHGGTTRPLLMAGVTASVATGGQIRRASRSSSRHLGSGFTMGGRHLALGYSFGLGLCQAVAAHVPSGLPWVPRPAGHGCSCFSFVLCQAAAARVPSGLPRVPRPAGQRWGGFECWSLSRCGGARSLRLAEGPPPGGATLRLAEGPPRPAGHV
jgi:hypothetical protein